MDLDLAGEYPSHVHRLSPALTLQGAVAHCDMPVENSDAVFFDPATVPARTVRRT